MFRSKAIILPLLLALSCLASVVHPAAGAEKGTLNDLMAGFEEKSAPQKDQVDSLLQGFDQSAQDTDPKTNQDSSQKTTDSILRGFDLPNTQEKESKEDSTETLMQAFEEKPQVDPKAVVTEQLLPQWLELSGDLSLRSVFNLNADAPEPNKTDHRGVTSLLAEAYLETEIDLPKNFEAKFSINAFYDTAYSINGRDDYTSQLLASQEQEVDLKEAWIQGSLLPSLDIKLGRQILVWGRSDNIRVTDILNPLDIREPGMTDIEDLRLPVVMTRLDYYYGRFNLTGVLVNEIRFNKQPVFGSPFFALDHPLPPDQKPNSEFDNQEIGLALNMDFSGWDFSLYGAYIFNDLSHLALTDQGLQRVHERLYMLGAATNIALGNWLIKAETAFFHGFEFFNDPDQKYNRLDFLAGIEYAGFSETTISFEVADRHIFDYDEKLENSPEHPEEDDLQFALRITSDFMHDRLIMTFLASIYGVSLDQGSFERLQLDYELTNSITLLAGLVFYQSGDHQPFQTASDQDRVFLKLKYSF